MTKTTESESFGARLHRLREEMGLKQAAAASLLNVSEQAISMYENDRRRPDFEGVSKLAGLYGVSLEYLMTGSVSGPKGPEDGEVAESDFSDLPLEARREIRSYIQYIRAKYRPESPEKEA